MFAERLQKLFNELYIAYGPQHWWPADNPFEIMIGAVLTQNTTWNNVERALDKLKKQIALEPAEILAFPLKELTETLRSTGYFNVKARRLRDFCEFFLNVGGLNNLRIQETTQLRECLLTVSGIGPETADDILLYAFERPVFVVDAYTKRIFGRLNLLTGQENYEQIRVLCETALPADVLMLQEYHALLVQHGKQSCRARPQCSDCLIKITCPSVQKFKLKSSSEVFKN